LTPDSIQQKYAQTVVSTRIVPGCVQFLGAEKRFHTAWVIRDGYTDRSPQADVSLSSESGPFGVLSGRVSSVGTADPPAVARCDDNFGFAVFSQKNRMPRWRTLRIPADTIAQAHKIATGAPEAGSALPHDSVTQDVAICAGCPQRCAQSCGVGLGVCSNSDPRGAHVA
jgi:hypothetical protein